MSEEAKKPSWASTGYEKAREISAAMDNRTEYFYLEDGKSATVRFLQDKPLCVFEHRVKVGEKHRTLTCLEGTGEVCPLCEANIPKTFKGYYSIMQDGMVKQYKVGVTVLKTLDKFFGKYNTLKDRTYEISRVGGGLKTTYTFAPDDKAPFSEAEKAAKLIDFEKILAPKTRTQIQGIMSAVHTEPEGEEAGDEAGSAAGGEAADDKVKF